MSLATSCTSWAHGGVNPYIAWTLAEALRTQQPALATARLGLSGALPLPIYVPLSLYADHRRQFAHDPNPHRRQLATFINHYPG